MVPKEMPQFLGSVRECLQLSPGSTKERKFGIKDHYRGPIASDMCALLLISVGTKCLITALPFLVRALNNHCCRHKIL